MFKVKSPCVLAAVFAVALLALNTSCAKKAVQKEETLGPPPQEEVQPVERPTAPSGTTGLARPSGPEEKTLAEDERERKEAEASFENEDIHFQFDRYDLEPRAREILSDKAFFLKKYPAVKVLIEGHCDERGTSEYNLALGERRANSAKQYLIQLGISDRRITTVSYGEERPMDSGHDEEAWAKNRRAHFVIASR